MQTSREQNQLDRYVENALRRTDPLLGLFCLSSMHRDQRSQWAGLLLAMAVDGSDRNQPRVRDLLRGTSVEAVEAATQNALRAVDPTDSSALSRLFEVISECALLESRDLFQEITEGTTDDEILELRRRFESVAWRNECWGRLLQDWPT